MRLSCRWLDDLVGLDGRSADEIARQLTFHTAPVEAVERRGAELDGVVTARVTAVRPHPNADRLRLCTVDTGRAPPIEVVCGAPNVAAGQVVCFAPEGLTLPNGMTLARRSIRGVESAGMICAEDELGLGQDHAGIIVLPAGTAVGMPAAEALGRRDEVLVVDNPSITHRPDLWGHVGYARELGALLGRPFTPPAAPLADAAFLTADEDPFPLAIEDEDGCRRYVGVVIESVTNGRSPWWLRSRLEALGMRSIDLLVDLSNLVMLEQGQPVHAFDLRDLEGQRIVVRRAQPGETMKTLDGEPRRLEETDLVIADARRVVALAGVMGGENSEVRADTTALLLESANFDPVRVRRTARRLGLRTEASTRFEKALDPESALAAARRFTELLLQCVPGARVRRRVADRYPRPAPPRQIALPYALASRRLGVRISDAEARANLSALGFRVHEAHEALLVDVPSWRTAKDVTLPEDLVEEIGRVHGYADVPLTPLVGALAPTRPAPLRRLERRVAAVLSRDLGYAESKSYAFYGPRDAERLGLRDVRHVTIANPISEDQDRLAQTAVASLLRLVAANVVREVAGRTWESTRLIVPAAKDLPTEVRVVALARWDREAAEDREGRVYRGLLDDLRAVLEAVPVNAVAFADATQAPALRPDLPAAGWLHPGRWAVVEAGGRRLAVAGEVAPSVLRAHDLPGRVAVAEVDLEALLAVRGEKGLSYHPVHRFPVVPFDVAVVVPRRTPAARVQATMEGVDPRAVRDVHLFDVYEGSGVPAGQRSLAFHLELLDPEGTLDARQSDRLRRAVIAALEREGWSIRAGP